MADAQEMLYRSMGRGLPLLELRQYVRDRFPHELIADYLWPNKSSGSGSGCVRYLQSQNDKGQYSRPLMDIVRNRADLVHYMHHTIPPVAALHMGELAIATPAQVVSHSWTVMREVVLDLDLRDWERVRPGSRSLLCSCNAQSSCRQCWALIELAAAACRAWMSNALGLGPILVVFSGGKGAHFHWAAPAARHLGPVERQRLAHLLSPAASPALMAAIANATSPVYGAIRTAVLEAWRALLARRRMTDAWPDSSRLRHYFMHEDDGHHTEDDSWWWTSYEARTPVAEVARRVLYLAWPVPDPDVLAGLVAAHQIKVPFSVHAKTHRIALPLNDADLAACDPSKMPTVTAVVQNHGHSQGQWQRSIDTMQTWLAGLDN